MLVVGVGTTGGQIVGSLVQSGHRVLVSDPDRRRVATVVAASREVEEYSGGEHRRDVEAVVVATPRGTSRRAVSAWIERGVPVVSVADDPDDVAELLDLDGLARRHGVSLVVGAGFAPGLTGLLARHGADHLDTVTQISVATTGTGGPACARQHHRAFKRSGQEWWNGQWIARRGGSGRELMWFPDPIGARDCYRGALVDPILISRGIRSSRRISARMSATRRDRFTSWLPMLRPPHLDGGPGAVRVEVRGVRNEAIETLVYGVFDRPSTAAALVAATVTGAALVGELPLGVSGTAELTPIELLRRLREKGMRIETYESST